MSKFVETTDNVWYNGNVRKKYVRKRKKWKNVKLVLFMEVLTCLM